MTRRCGHTRCTCNHYCAWFAVGGNQWNERFPTFAAALDEFRRVQDEFGFDTVPEVQQSTLDLYPVCADCTGGENHHDYPMARFVIGIRGGIVRERV